MRTTATTRCLVSLAASAIVIVAMPGAAWAKPTHGGGSGGSGGFGGGSTAPAGTGIDASYPQCGTTLPATAAFAVIGVNDGLANTYSPCLGGQWSYATKLVKGSSQPVAQAYVNTADPGNGVSDWPSPSNEGAFGTATTPYGTCGWANGSSGPGANSQACAYTYGYDMVAGFGGGVIGDEQAFTNATGATAGLSGDVVWLDVETGNSWETGSAGLADNVADLQGMVAALQARGSTVGVYSTSYQWGAITGTPTGATAGDLGGLSDWLAGASTASGAQANCGLTGFTTTAHPVLTQWVASLDGDVSCAG